MKKYLLTAVVIAVMTAAGFWFGRHSQMSGDAAPAATSAARPDRARKPLYWFDPQRPEVHFDKPGKSPFMDMQLVPKYDGAGDAGAVTIDARTVQNLGVRLATVERSAFQRRVSAVGAVQADERRIEVLQSRAEGWVERLYVRAVNSVVRRGELLAEVYSPNLLAAQREFLLALRASREHPGIDTLAAASRERLSFLGLSESQLAQLERSGTAQRRVAFYSPINGVVAELGVREGMQVTPGMTLFRLVELSRVWVMAEIPEVQAAGVAAGQSAQARVAAFPERVFAGRVDFVYPEVAAETRTVQARIVLENPDLVLKPGMFASVILSGLENPSALRVPSEALIKTGTRSVVVVAEGDGRFSPVEVTVGGEYAGHTEILQGLTEGQRVVTSGQFLIDSEANLRGVLTRMQPVGKAP